MMETLTRDRAESAFPIVSKLVDFINTIPNRDRAKSCFDARYAIHSLAEEVGFYRLVTPEEKAIASAMENIFCGPRSALYGWRLYARYRQGGMLNPLSITY